MEGRLFVETLTEAERDISEKVNGLFYILSKKFKFQHNQTILSLQCYKLVWNAERSIEEWMDILRIKTIESKYKKIED